MEVRELYATQNKVNSKVKLEEPVYVFLTAFSTVHFRKHVAGLGVKNVYEKPIQLEHLKIIFEQNTWMRWNSYDSLEVPLLNKERSYWYIAD